MIAIETKIVWELVDIEQELDELGGSSLLESLE